MKPWYTSKTMWVNLAAAAFGAVLTFESEIERALAGDKVGMILLVSGVANVVLRSITSTGVSLK